MGSPALVCSSHAATPSLPTVDSITANTSESNLDRVFDAEEEAEVAAATSLSR